MTKPEFIAEVAKSAGTTKADAEKVVNAVIDTIQNTLKNGGSVQLVGFGTFEVKTRAAREGVNPRTKQKIKIPAKKTPSFKVGKKLKDAVI